MGVAGESASPTRYFVKEQPVRRWMGARLTLPDHSAAIGGGEILGVYYATGHAHLGPTLAALTGELVRDMVTGNPPAVDLAPFSLGRSARKSLTGHQVPTSEYRKPHPKRARPGKLDVQLMRNLFFLHRRPHGGQSCSAGCGGRTVS